VSSAARSRAVLALALAVFAALGLAMSRRMMVFSEEFIILPAPSRRVLAPRPGPDGRPREEPSCRDAPPRRLLLSGERPTLSLCVGARRFPVMAAPQFAGLFLWPLELLRPLHRDDPFAVRALLLPLGALAIALGYRLTARLGGRRLAALGALGTAVSPCFVSLTAIVQQFETLPWIFLLASLLALTGCPELAPPREGAAPAEGPPSTARLVAGALCAGLAVLANVKALFCLAPLAALALRLGARPGAVRPRQRAAMAAVALGALLPMAAPFALDPSMGWAQGKGGDWRRDLAANLLRPTKALEAARDLVLMWSDFGSYLVGARPSLPSLLVAGAAFAFVLADTARTLARRRGCPVTAGCGVIMLAYLAVVTLLYAEFPANYTPLHGVYGLALGCAAHRLAGWLQARRIPPAAAALLAAAAVTGPFAASTVGSIRAFAEIPFVTNSRAERDLVRYLEAHPEPGSVTVTMNLLLGGVPDALSRGRVETVQAHRWFGVCERGESRADPAECLRGRWAALLRDRPGVRVTRVVVPASLAFVRRPPALLRAQVAQLERAARELGLALRLERTFSTPAGAPAARLYRLERPAAAPALIPAAVAWDARPPHEGPLR
jgi:hypothetical protein